MDVVQFSTDIQFALNHCPTDYSIAFETYLFNEPQYFQLYTSTPPLSFYILNTKKEFVLGRIRFFIKGRQALSLPQSPFGGMEINPRLSLALIDEFLFFIESHFAAIGIKTTIVKQFPFTYSEESSSKITNAFIRNGFKVSNPDINHHIVVNSIGLVDKVHSMEKRKIKKVIDGNFVFKEEGFGSLDSIYNFILACRLEKEQNLNTSLVDLQKAVNAMPANYKIFTLGDREKIIACSIVVIVNERIAYNFLPASSTEYKSYSPMVFLLANIYNYCYLNNVQIFDLGISAVDNLPQNTLIDFKERVGGVAGLKCTFEKEIISL